MHKHTTFYVALTGNSSAKRDEKLTLIINYLQLQQNKNQKSLLINFCMDFVAPEKKFAHRFGVKIDKSGGLKDGYQEIPVP
jgi:hypothetical protein